MRILRTISLLFLVLLLLPMVSLALELTYPEFGRCGDRPCRLTDQTSINELVAWLYYGIITIGGLAAFFMIVWGGFQYLTSAGSPGAMNEAKDRVFNAIFGLLLIFMSYIILQVINPELLLLKLSTL